MSFSPTNNFILQIQTVEKEQIKRLENAKKKANSELHEQTKQLEANKESELNIAREQAKKEINEQKKLAKARYQHKLEENARFIETFKHEKQIKMQEQIPAAKTYFLTINF